MGRVTLISVQALFVEGGNIPNSKPWPSCCFLGPEVSGLGFRVKGLGYRV